MKACPTPSRSLRWLGIAGFTLAAAFAPRVALAENACVIAYEKAQEERVKNDLLEARRRLDQCIGVCPTQLRDECTVWRDELDRYLSSVWLRVVDPTGARVRIDAAFVDARPVEPLAEVMLVPGVHLVRVEIGERSFEKRIVTKAQARGVLVDIVTSPSRESDTAAPATNGAASERTARPTKVPSIVAFSVGAVSAITAVSLAIYGHARRAEFDESCSPNCGQARIDQIATTWWVAAGLGVGAAAGLAVGILLWPTHKVTVTAAPRAVSLSVLF